MTSNPAATLSRTVAVWQWTSGADISGKTPARNLTTSGITPGFIDDFAGTFTGTSKASLTNPTFLELENLSAEFLIQPTTMTTTGFILRAGSSITLDVGFGVRIFGSSTVWSMFKKGSQDTEINSVVQFSNSTVAPVFGQLYHVVAVAQGNPAAFNRMYIDGNEIALTHTNTQFVTGVVQPTVPLSGIMAMTSTYDLIIGDPPISAAGFPGVLGRMVLYPYAMTQSQATASYRLQRVQFQGVSGLGAPSPAGAANHGPAAVPFLAGPVDENVSININTAGRAFDADGNALTAIAHPTAPTQGQSSIVSGQLRYTPSGGTGGGLRHTVPFRVRETAATNLQSDSIVLVSVNTSAPPTPPIAVADPGYTTAFNTAITIPVTANDTVNGATITAWSNPPRGTATLNTAAQTITYTPDTGLSGADSFTYTLGNTFGTSTATVSVTVGAAPTPPIAVADPGYTTAFNTAITIPVTANDTVNGATITAWSNPPRGTATLNTAAQTITYTPDTGLSGADSFTYTLGNTFGTSTATVSVTVSAAPPPPPPTSDDLPVTPTANDRFPTGSGSTLYANLVTAYNAAVPNTTIWLPANSSLTGSALTFARTDFTAAAPLVIRPVGNAWGSVDFNMTVVVSGANHVFAGAGFNNVGGENIRLNGQGSRVTRCKIIHTALAQCIGIVISGFGKSNQRCDHNEISILTGSSAASSNCMCLRLGDCGTHTLLGLPTAPTIDHNWIHDCNGLTAAEAAAANGREAIQLGEGHCSALVDVNALCQFNLVERCTNESEAISVKSSGNRMYNNIIRNCGIGAMSQRVGDNGDWQANSSESSAGFVIWGGSHTYLSNSVTGGNSIRMQAGSATVATYNSTPYQNRGTLANWAASQNCNLYRNSTVTVGRSSGANLTVVTRDHNILNGTVTFHSDGFYQNINQTGTSPMAARAIVPLLGGTAAGTGVNCGIFGVD